MKISILSVAPPYRGGISEQTSYLYNALKESHEVKIINFTKQYPDFLFPGKSQFDTNLNVGSLENNLRVINSINPFSWLKAIKCILAQSPDLVILRFWNPFFAICHGFIIKRLKKIAPNIKVIAICDNIIPHERHLIDIYLIKFLFSSIDAFIVMSEQVESELLSLFPDAEYDKLFHPIVSREANYSKIESREMLNIFNKNIILFYGFIRDYKGLDVLIRSNEYLFDKLDDYKIIICGEPYGNDNKYRKLISKYNFNNEILWVDKYISDELTEKYFTASDIVVLPYKSASQSGVIPLSYSYETPVIASNISGIREMIVNRKTGLVFEKNNYIDLSDKIISFFESDVDYKAHINDFRNDFSWNNFVKQIIKLHNMI